MPAMEVRKAIKIIAISLMFMRPGAGFCQENGPRLEHDVVQLSATATQDVVPDWLSMTLVSTVDGADAATVQSQLRKTLGQALDQARQAVQEPGLSVHTGAFTLQPRYGRDGQITGWRGSTELVLEGSDFARIAAQASALRGMVVGGTAFSLSRVLRSKVEAEVQDSAIVRFKATAADIARSFGFAGYSLREVAVNSSEPGPRGRLMALAAAPAGEAPLPLEAGRSTVSVSVAGSIRLQ